MIIKLEYKDLKGGGRDLFEDSGNLRKTAKNLKVSNNPAPEVLRNGTKAKIIVRLDCCVPAKIQPFPQQDPDKQSWS
jgi:hypothetical protein